LLNPVCGLLLVRRQHLADPWLDLRVTDAHEEDVLLDSREVTRAIGAFGADHRGCHLDVGTREDLIEQEAQTVDLLLVDRDDEYRALGVEQFLRQQEPPLHEGEPLAVTVGVGVVDVVVVVLPVACAGVVGRIDVDAIDLAGVCELERLEHVVVLALDDHVGWLVATAVDGSEPPEPGVDRLTEVGGHDQGVDRVLLVDDCCAFLG